MELTPYVSVGNTSYTALNAAANFTGGWEDVCKYSSIVAAVSASHAGTLYLEFSTRNTGNAESTLTFAVEGGTNEVHRLTITRKYFRARYVNGSTNQTSFTLQVIVGNQITLSSPANLSLQQDADSVAVRSIDAEIDIIQGKRVGYAIVNKFGKNSSTSAGTDVAEQGTVYAGFPLSDVETVTVISTSANDASAGSGARTIRITGLNSDYEIQTETLTLNGTTGVDSVNTFRRVHTAQVLTSGSSNQAFNAGDITVRHTTTTTNIFLKMVSGTNQTNASAYTVPAGKTAYMRRITSAIRGVSSVSASGAIWVRAFGGSPRYRRPFSVAAGVSLVDDIYGGLIFPEKTDIVIRITAVSSGTPEIVAGYDLILVDN